MKNILKKSVLIATIIVLLISMISNRVYAEDKSLNLKTTKEYIYEINYPNGYTLPDSTDYNKVITVKDSTFDGIVDEHGNITVPSKKQMKEKYLEKFNNNPELYKDSIKKIDGIVEETITVIKNAKAKKATSPNIDLSSSEFTVSGLFSSSYWHIQPYVTNSTNGITYSTTWVGFDNYKSQVAIKCTYDKDLKVTKTIGFTGAIEIKNTFGFSGTYAEEQTASITTEMTIPEWTVWDTRPYITWTKNDYLGAWTVESYNPLTGNTTYTTSSKTGSNIIRRVSNNESWSAYNDSHSNTATTPLPPSGVPNVAWQ